MNRILRAPLFALCLVIAGCGGGGDSGATDTVAAGVASDGGAGDGGAGDGAALDASDAADATDAATNDATSDATQDAGTDDANAAQDATPQDSSADASAGDAVGPKSSPWGPITGACGAVAAELGASTPSFHTTTLTFDKAPAFDPKPLAAGPKKRYEGDNAGGSSQCSEVMSMQLLHDCEGAKLYKTEKEVVYTSKDGAITDYITTIAGQKVGVSVTRAYKGPTITTYTKQDATKLLTKKLEGINVSSAKISAADKWTKQVLHVWTLRPDWVPVLQEAWGALDAKVKADTVVLVSVEVPPAGSKGWIVPDDCGL